LTCHLVFLFIDDNCVQIIINRQMEQLFALYHERITLPHLFALLSQMKYPMLSFFMVISFILVSVIFIFILPFYHIVERFVNEVLVEDTSMTGIHICL